MNDELMFFLTNGENLMMAQKKQGLGERHKKILAVLDYYQSEVGYPPSIREIGKEADISSTSVVNYYLNQLEEMGYIERDKKVSRGMRLIKNISGKLQETVKSLEDILRIPIVGRIGAGIVDQNIGGSNFGIFGDEDRIDVARSMLSKSDQQEELFALQVEGNSMVDAMVNDGDLVIMKPAQVANNGEMVAVRFTDNEDTTLKYFHREDGHVRLQPANPLMEPIIIEDPSQIQIQGTVVMVIRNIGGSKH
jgi:repressor LexA